MSVPDFFLMFFKKLNFFTCQADMSCHMVVIVWCDNGSSTCQYYVRWFSHPQFGPNIFILSQFSQIFIKIVQFPSSPNWNKNQFL